MALTVAGPPPPAAASGFRLLADGLDAFVARAFVAREARRSLDLQYYLISADDTGRLLAAEVLAAADRGVQVRILLDDLYTARADRAIARFDSHPRIEVRLFNPWTRWRGSLGRGFGFLLAPGRLNRRMHNKLFAADGRVAIVGGRNIGDEYFDRESRMNFRDLDVLATGPAAAQAGASFERYWHSRWAVPVAKLRGHASPPAGLDALRAALAAHRLSLRDSGFVRALEDSALARKFAAGDLALEPGAAQLIADSPSKIEGGGSGGEGLVDRLRRRAPLARQELLISSPYFVPRERGVQELADLVRAGVTVSVLTNSLAATDVGIVHGSYARHRAALLRGGVRLHELRPTSPLARRRFERRRFGSENVSLHAKYLVIDRHTLFIGSLNLDPRSIERNTEVGLLIESAALARRAAALFEVASSRAFSYSVALRDGPAGRSDALLWAGEGTDGELRYDHDPGTTWWRRQLVRFAGLLPFVESQV